MSDTRAESPQQQDAENDIAGVSSTIQYYMAVVAPKKMQNKYGNFSTKCVYCTGAFCGIVQCLDRFTWN